ncbi:hypothetical protein SDC9_203756 [bioreactor metagenome]|uniref:Uncharacterized protein n=1 Tax=bioreactor metagenome TaxID=1076179 RepID=A0A645IYU9_9ZZZZ
MCQLAVVCHQQQAFGVEIQPADVVEPRGDIFDIFLNRSSPLRIIACADHALGFIEHDGDQFLRLPDGPSIQQNRIGFRIHAHAQRRRLAVNADASGVDQRLARAPGGDSGFRQIFLQSHHVGAFLLLHTVVQGALSR